MPMGRLPFPSVVIASANDQYVAPARAQAFASAWGSEFVILGNAGHINGEAGYGVWPDGEKMLLEFCRRVQG
jgi:predicted alpha/beta hydrolase family esterase